MTTVNSSKAPEYKGTKKLIIGIVFGVITFWLFAQAMVNVVPAVQEDLGIELGTLNIAISLSALFSGIFIVAAGGLADVLGRKKLTYIGLILSIVGSLCLVFANGAGLLIIGRVIQGLSAACIMPATIALVKAYYEGEDRQRALSYWSIGSWGGSGICSFAGGAIATYMGWKWIFIFSIVFALLAMILIKDTPESKTEQTGPFKFDYTGLTIFVITMLALNIFITQGSKLGWTSITSLLLLAITIIGIVVFVKYELGKTGPLIDFELFKNKAYTGATISNFLLNAVAGTLVVANTYVQVGRGFTAFQSGMLSIGYLVAVLGMIRVGEKILQKIGAKKPMVWGTIITGIGVALMALTFLPGVMYTVVVFIGFAMFGLGLGIYATPSTDTAVSNAPDDKIGVASGIYKMASSLGGAFGVAISATVYSIILTQSGIDVAATAGIVTNVIFAVIALISIVILVPNNTGKKVA
ncbi:DHA2 family multidrug resistance protein-like MFS transporter [Psychrobacillus insolitus]|uniref:DHA2 family multidrug resistance protein-like MFS transporter n=1 Tax=Psychrobacillus insolitus TaxID=1461 RepID=A0A2W7MFT0_9BACI|nr:MFS transporter [Psychrobacillus insolitus]PZX05693.1 DHA2 family multidrug resistance protein-like MFS transporter [Psychrobacillus insolitus]